MRVQHLFYSTDTDQQTLHSRITPTEEQRGQQQERWNDVRDYLIDDLSQKTGLPISSWLQGSYKFGTQVRPVRGGEFDIDLGIYFGWPGDPEEAPCEPVELKALVQASLAAYAKEAEDDVLEVVTPPKERCSRIRFSGKFHIDVPSYHLDAAADARELATQTHGWEVSDPKAFYVWFLELFEDDEHAQVRRIIRYFKAWANLNLDTPPPSVLLTVLVAQAYLDLTAEQCETDDVALRHIAETMSARLTNNATVPNPAQSSENLNRLDPEAFQDFLEVLNGVVAIADAALDANSEVDAAHDWARAFHHFFPAPRAAITPVTEQALVPVAFDPLVRVEATPDAGTHVFRGTNQLGPIPKNCTIRFALANAHQLPAGAEVRWTVRNEGDEAEGINDLGHLAGRGTIAEEHSAYRGTHYMDVVVTSALGAVLGYRRIPVQIQGVPMPPRNPKKPGWTRLRRR